MEQIIDLYAGQYKGFDFMSKKCCFSGQSTSYSFADRKKLYEICERLIHRGVIEFYIGNDGNFNRLATEVLCDLKEQHPAIVRTLLLPCYTPESIRSLAGRTERYDRILSAEVVPTLYVQEQLQKAYEIMIDRSDYLVCAVVNSGVTPRMLAYAERKRSMTICYLKK